MKPAILTICAVTILLFAFNNEKNPNETTNPGEFHKMLARSNGTWMGEGTMQFSPDAPPVYAGTSILINTMAMDGLYQI